MQMGPVVLLQANGQDNARGPSNERLWAPAGKQELLKCPSAHRLDILTASLCLMRLNSIPQTNTAPTPAVAWARPQVGHKATMVVNLRNHSRPGQEGGGGGMTTWGLKSVLPAHVGLEGGGEVGGERACLGVVCADYLGSAAA